MRRITSMAIVCLFFCFGMLSVQAGEPVSKSVEALYKDKASLNGQQVQLQGKIVKVNNQIMGRNFLHLQDGTGSASDGTNDVTVTSQETAEIGDQVTITGTVVVDHDFGSGYRYPLLVEKANISKAK